MRRLAVVTVAAGLIAAACGPLTHRGPPARDDRGFVSAAQWRARQDDYLRFATQQFDPGSPLNALAHVTRSGRDPRFAFDPSVLTPEHYAPIFARIDTFEDTTDFDLLYLLNLWLTARDELGPELRDAIEARFLAFKYWYTEPNPPGVIDDKWYWSENHRIIFHTLEYLVGQEFPDAVFTNDGRTGSEHRAHAQQLIEEWIDEKVRFGFSEWHSDVYYQKDVTPLLSLVEWADDPVLANRAAMALDLVLLDVAVHLQEGNLGATHGRSYMKDKSRAVDQDVFGLAKLAFADTDQPYPSRGDAGATLLARAQRYRVPEVLERIATSRATTVDRERMGVPLDPGAPVTADPPAPYGYDFDDPANVPFWWERGAFTSWQVVPTTLETADQFGLWETELFQPFVPLRDITGGDPDVAQSLAQSLHRMVALGLLSEVDTYTYRSPDVMLSSAQDYRAGSFGEQYHAWQATLDEDAIVFTTHPKNEPQVGTRWPDSDGYFTGTGSMPRSAQQGAAAIHLYAPQFASPGPGVLEAFSYLPYTHAYFPQERFDEVVTEGGWTFGRRGRGYVALWSWRPTEWRALDPTTYFTNGLTQPFDLVAPGGADNVWVVQVGDAHAFGSFERFRAAITENPVEVTPLAPVGDLAGGFNVAYSSPTEGELQFSWTGPLLVGSREVPIHGYPRMSNPWSEVDFESQVVIVRDGVRSLRLDFATGRRQVS